MHHTKRSCYGGTSVRRPDQLILLDEAGIRTNLDNWMMSETPLDVARKWACQMEKATYAVLVNKYVELYMTPHDTMRFVLNVTQNLLINVNNNICMNAQ
jgi:hypothetical protein